MRLVWLTIELSMAGQISSSSFGRVRLSAVIYSAQQMLAADFYPGSGIQETSSGRLGEGAA
jgi:hypothetical protein